MKNRKIIALFSWNCCRNKKEWMLDKNKDKWLFISFCLFYFLIYSFLLMYSEDKSLSIVKVGCFILKEINTASTRWISTLQINLFTMFFFWDSSNYFRMYTAYIIRLPWIIQVWKGDDFEKCSDSWYYQNNCLCSEYLLSYLPTPPLEQDMTQGQF